MIDSLINALKSWVRRPKNYFLGLLIIASSIVSLAVTLAILSVTISFVIEQLFIEKFERLLTERFEDRAVTVSFTDSGATQVKISGKLKSAIFPVFASQGWIDSGITIPPGATVEITASGQANLAIHRLVEAAEEDFRPDFPWTGPEGVDFQSTNPRDTRRKKGLIVQKDNIGALLAYLHIDGGDKSEPDLLDNPRPTGIRVIKQGRKITNKSEQEATLWFIVNDVVLDSSDESAQMYLPDKNNPDYQEKKEKWDYVKQEQYWDIWFDDNSGFYQVIVENVKE